MQAIVEEIIELFGLNYVPTNFGELIVWFVTVMCAVGIVCGVMKLMFYLSVNVGRIAR